MTLAEELRWRGFIQDTTLEDVERFNAQPWNLYIGFDATAPSQTIGNLAPMMAVKTFLRHGHKAIILAGGATSLIGDPGGKESERTLQDKEYIGQNVANAVEQFGAIFKDTPVTYVNNLDWYKDFNVLDFLREVGKNFSMTPLIQRDYIASRLGEGGTGISYAEFSYTLLQGYDYLKLFEDHGCNLQLGGSDQWGNCLSGVDLIRRKHQQATHVMTMPLIINQATGKKFGKSEDQTIWLDPEMTHPSDFYQFWFNTSDLDALNYLKIFTELSQDEIDEISRLQADNPAGRAAQKRLAEEVTRMIHGDNNLAICQLFAELAFAASKQPSLSKDLDEIKSVLSSEPEGRKITLRGEPQNEEAINRSLEALFTELLEKIPTLESRSQIRELYNNKALKMLALDQAQGEPTSITGALDDDCWRSEEVWPTSSKDVVLIIIGKNTIRAINYTNLSRQED